MKSAMEIAAELSDKTDVAVDLSVARRRLKIIGSPQLLRVAQQLYQFAKSNTEDHSTYAIFLHDLDALMRRHGARPERPERQDRYSDDYQDDEDDYPEDDRENVDEMEAPRADEDDEPEDGRH